MYAVEDILKMAAQLAGRGDKLPMEELNVALRILNSILTEWATVRDVHLWNIVEASQALPTPDTVLHNSIYYQCYNPHTSASENEPGVGALWENYWKLAPEVPTPLTWMASISYSPNNLVLFDNLYVEDIIGLRVLHAGQFSPVEKISMLDYVNLDHQEFGLPTHAHVQKSATGTSAQFFPVNNQQNATLYYYEIRRPYELDHNQTTSIPNQWISALYYALAVELGFVYNIGIERLNMLGQKAQFEFNKAFRTNESEVDRCFVKPAY
jgi:hypothetical protein